MNRIKILRLVNNKTQKDIADYLEVSAPMIAYYENEKRKPKPETWQALADYFNVSVPYLRGATTYEVLDSAEKDIYNYVISAMGRVFNDCVLLPVQQERILKAIAYSIDNGEFN